MRVKNERRRHEAKDLQALRGPVMLPLAPKVRTRNPHEPDTTTYTHTQCVRADGGMAVGLAAMFTFCLL